MENKFKYLVAEYPYGSVAHNKAFSEKINQCGNDGWKLVSSQLKPFKSATSNSYEMVCIFEKSML